MLLASERVKEVREQEVAQAPAGVDALERGPRGRVGREVLDQDREPTKRQATPVEVAQVDAVEALKVGLYGAAVLAEQGEELVQFPERPRAF